VVKAKKHVFQSTNYHPCHRKKSPLLALISPHVLEKINIFVARIGSLASCGFPRFTTRHRQHACLRAIVDIADEADRSGHPERGPCGMLSQNPPGYPKIAGEWLGNGWGMDVDSHIGNFIGFDPSTCDFCIIFLEKIGSGGATTSFPTI